LASWFLFFLGQHKKFLIALPEFLFFYIGLYFFSFLFLFSNSLIFVALGLVSVSLVTYFFLGSGNNLISSEISVKYYIVSSFALCLFFFGFWLIFLGSNTVNLLDLVCYFKYSNFSTSEQVLLSLG
jgi:NADH:ubiquinone oxidoreductase subunit 2 (subunit N)